MSGSAPVDLMSMDGLNYFVPVPPVCVCATGVTGAGATGVTLLLTQL